MNINTIYNGDALEVLKTFPDNSIDCCISSPPYYALRYYGDTVKSIFGGDKNCEHEFIEHKTKLLHENRQNLDGGTIGNPAYRENLHGFGNSTAGYCRKCNAWKGQLGLEPTFHEYLNHLIEIYAEVKRVLKPTGTIWVNLGDSYSGSSNGAGNKTTTNRNKPESYKEMYKGQKCGKQLMDKSLLNIPSRFAIKMTDELNLILRNEIIWYKPNCMPSSAKDRFTVDFEKIYFFVKNKKYWFETQYESFDSNSYDRKRMESRKEYTGKWSEGYNSMPGLQRAFVAGNQQGRNKRCVWKVTTKPYKEAHFAVYPEDLVKPMIQAGCPENGMVLDIFAGSGTTLKVAKELGRNYIGIELNPEYIKLINKRLDSVPLRLAI